MKVVGINGINTHGKTNIDLLLLEMSLRGWDTKDIRLPKRNFISAWWGAKPDSEQILDETEDGDILVAHSFGCLRAAHAERSRRYSALFLIAPAMSRDWEFHNPGSVQCFCSSDDWVVKLGSLIPFHPFGKAGTSGFDQLWPYGSNFFLPGGHSGYFEEPNLVKLGLHIHNAGRVYSSDNSN